MWWWCKAMIRLGTEWLSTTWASLVKSRWLEASGGPSFASLFPFLQLDDWTHYHRHWHHHQHHIVKGVKRSSVYCLPSCLLLQTTWKQPWPPFSQTYRWCPCSEFHVCTATINVKFGCLIGTIPSQSSKALEKGHFHFLIQCILLRPSE